MVSNQASDSVSRSKLILDGIGSPPSKTLQESYKAGQKWMIFGRIIHFQTTFDMKNAPELEFRSHW